MRSFFFCFSGGPGYGISARRSITEMGMMSASDDPYVVLGISRSAGPREIRRAFHRQVLQVHPDLHPADPASPERFKTVVGAYRQIARRSARTYAAFLHDFDPDSGKWKLDLLPVRRRRHNGANLPVRWRRAAGSFMSEHARAIPIVASLILSTLITVLGLLSESAAEASSAVLNILPPASITSLLG